MKGRKPIRNTYNPNKELFNFIFKLLYSFDLERYFKNGRFSIFFEKDKIKLIYVKNNIEFSNSLEINAKSRPEKDEIIYQIQEFILNCFYLYEWDGKPMKLRDLSGLLLVSPQAIDNEIKKEFQKIAQKAEEKGIVLD